MTQLVLRPPTTFLQSFRPVNNSRVRKIIIMSFSLISFHRLATKRLFKQVYILIIIYCETFFSISFFASRLARARNLTRRNLMKTPTSVIFHFSSLAEGRVTTEAFMSSTVVSVFMKIEHLLWICRSGNIKVIFHVAHEMTMNDGF